MHPIRETLRFLVPDDGGDFSEKLGRITEWAHRRYGADEAGPDGQVRGLGHCQHDAESAGKVLRGARFQPGLTLTEGYLLGAALVVHDVGRRTNEDDHGTESARLFTDAGDTLGLSRGETGFVSHMVRVHHLQGDALIVGIRGIPETAKADTLGGDAVRLRLLTLILKMADLMDTSELRLTRVSPATDRMRKRSTRTVRLARKCITFADVDESGHSIVMSAHANTPAELAAVDAYMMEVSRREVEPVAGFLSDAHLPRSLKPDIDEEQVSKDTPPAVAQSPGLYWFGSDQRAIFRGREDDVSDLLQRIHWTRPPLLRLLGVSGAGKSSLIAAGLTPPLQRAGWQCLHLRPDPGPGGEPGWACMAGAPGRWDSLTVPVEVLSRTHAATFNTVGALVVLDQLEDLVTRCTWDPEWLEGELRLLLAHGGWVTTLLAYRGEHETTFGPLVEKVTDAKCAGPFYLQMLTQEQAKDALLASPEIAREQFVPESLVDDLVLAVHKETFREFSAFGVYPPYVQILVEAVSAGKSADGVFDRDCWEAAKMGGSAGALVGTYLHRRLERLKEAGLDPGEGRAVLNALVDTHDGGRKGRAERDWVRTYTGLPEERVADLLVRLSALRLVRPLGADLFEIAHDYLARLVTESMTPEERHERGLVDLLDIRARNYTYSHVLLSEDELTGLFAMRKRLQGSINTERARVLLLSRYVAERGPAPDGGARPSWWAAGLFERPGVLDACREGLRAPEPNLRVGCARMVGYIGDRQATPWLKGLLVDPYADVRQAAIEALTALVDRQATLWLKEWLPGRGADVTNAAVDAVPYIGDRQAMKWLKDLLRDPHWEVRQAVVRALASRGGWQAIPWLRAWMADPKWGIQDTAAGIVATLGGQQAISLLKQWLVDPHWEVRKAAVEALAALGDRRAAPWLKELLSDPEAAVRHAAVGAVAALGGGEAVPLLRMRLCDQHWDVRRAAVNALADLGDRQAIPWLKELWADPQREVRQAVQRALPTLGEHHVFFWEGGSRTRPTPKELLVNMDSHVRQGAAQDLCRLANAEEIEAIADGLGSRIATDVATIFDWHLYAPDFVKDAFSKEQSRGE